MTDVGFIWVEPSIINNTFFPKALLVLYFLRETNALTWLPSYNKMAAYTLVEVTSDPQHLQKHHLRPGRHSGLA